MMDLRYFCDHLTNIQHLICLVLSDKVKTGMNYHIFIVYAQNI